MHVHHFVVHYVQKYPRRYIVDLLHFSPPCQPFSTCHTKAGRDDEANTAASFCIVALLQGCRPRQATFEQTFGVMRESKRWWFDAIIRQFTDCDYSVQWRVENLAETGLVHARERLILVAAAPGEELMEHPSPTHGIGPDLLPFTTIRDRLSIVQRDNIPENLTWFTPKDQTPYNLIKQLQYCITTTGGVGNLHLNGKRTFTLGELAVLAGFETWHRFAGSKTEILKQIGNAAPTSYMKQLFRNAIKTIKRTDVKREASKIADHIVID
ncbi:S-adenosyl-L-methionine-dependent methyltransferase [Polychaeton citri CBS 116435]|uniref:DNA (cytosine-5-)-methyltransferase n=1 Tax=Polychaeton citri CBS 116435 TaxID=1314669 RepID=A0A9P4Q9F6_9PEZI|nr:S-adenosyl-L-methionine-dependent methyltransferase [Polychaeton citri CBS 116435]